MNKENILYSEIRRLWKDTRKSNVVENGFFHCCGKTDAEKTYRQIQNEFREKKTSAKQTLNILSLMHKFATKKENLSHPFSIALNNNFRLSEIKYNDIEKHEELLIHYHRIKEEDPRPNTKHFVYIENDCGYIHQCHFLTPR